MIAALSEKKQTLLFNCGDDKNLYSQLPHTVWPVFSLHAAPASLSDGKNPRPSGIPRL
jgi:hypothetical protein